ncbi:hypothetical protein DICPUDRAFT_147279 [Dictyostelium purpureum]|uniref:Aminotransferase class V domain-containing protein n=1 Tax=Dictyostelium purpureum TaxID=5786 RepID=F0Z835_DICPU|nr:uncharacterized protein DICPUDRAFT_147279 [Dictyostelium purpureum]EGC39922.1 hypothetical protein DICPUDRAFT_147279 [Dictyostelium purpureum]|eukprot:XP_003283551.1 hypothetical protein DICPUDRAFT_147279 [Dictyostelium purpureum]
MQLRFQRFYYSSMFEGLSAPYPAHIIINFNVKIQIILSYTLIIGLFSAASNVSGILEDTIAITELLKQYNALSFWDCTCAAPNIQIDMNRLNDSSFKKQCSL